MPVVSVIMPVYNSERYLRDAVDSVLKQTWPDFELILVDDGSTDGSPAICDGYAQADPRVIVVHQANTGICGARNKGMQLAGGEYLAFSDHDDVWLPALLEDNLNLAREHDAEVVKFGYQVDEIYADGREFHRQTVSDELHVITRDQLAACYKTTKASGFFNMVWNGLYKRSFLQQNALIFDESIKFGYEDWAFNNQLYPLLRQMVLNPKVYYQHLMRFGISTSTKFYPERLQGCLKAAQTEHALFETLGIARSASWKDATVSYLIELTSLLNIPQCSMTLQEKSAFFDEVQTNPAFASVIGVEQGSDQSLSFIRRMVASLFCHRRYRLLLFLSKLYEPYADYKVRKAK